MDKEKKEKWKQLFKNPKKGLKEIKKGIDNLSVKEQTKSQIIMVKGTMIGLIFAWGVMLFRGFWYFSIVMFFGIGLNYLSLIGAKQKLVNIEKSEELQKELVEQLKQQEELGEVARIL